MLKNFTAVANKPAVRVAAFVVANVALVAAAQIVANKLSKKIEEN